MGHLTKSPMAQNRRSAVGSAGRFARRGTQLGCRALAATTWLGSRRAFRRTSWSALRRVQHQSVTQASKQAKTSLCRDEHRIRQTPSAPRHADRRPCPQATTSILEERTNEQNCLDSHFRVGSRSFRRTSANPYSSGAPGLLAGCVAALSKANVRRRLRRSAVPPATPRAAWQGVQEGF